VGRGLRRYVVVNFVLVVVATTGLMLGKGALSPAWLWGVAGLVLLTLVTLAGLIEERRWARPLEVARMVAVAAALVWCLKIP
jgi:hypothetical protein